MVGTSSGAPVGTIVGSIIGVLAALLIVGLVVFFLRRRKNNRENKDQEGMSSGKPPSESFRGTNTVFGRGSDTASEKSADQPEDVYNASTNVTSYDDEYDYDSSDEPQNEQVSSFYPPYHTGPEY